MIHANVDTGQKLEPFHHHSPILRHGGARLAGFEARAPRKKSLETGRIYIYIYTRDMEPLCKRTCSIGDTLQAPSVLNHRQTPQGCRSNSLGVTSIGFVGFAKKEQDRRERDRHSPPMRTDRGKCCQ